MQRSLSIQPRGPRSADRVRVLAFGLGPIGRAAAQLAAGRIEQFELVGAVDCDPNLAGRPLGEVLGVALPDGVTVAPSLEAWDGEADVALHCTGSRLTGVAEQLRACAARKLNVVSSCEELFYPHLQGAELAEQLDRDAREHGVTLVGCGINPGFLMDLLPKMLALAVGRVDHVFCSRVVDARLRRGPLQRKVGAGMTVEAFNSRADAHTIGHVGLVESVAYLADELNLPIDAIDESLEPAVAAQAYRTEYVQVEPGQVAGIHHQALGKVGEREVIHLSLTMAVGAEDPHDRVVIRGEPDVDFRSTPCIAGDGATAAMLVNLAGKVVPASSGLHAPDGIVLGRSGGGRLASC